MWESAVAEALATQVSRLEATGGVTVAFLASGGQTRVRLTAKATSRDEALALIEPEERAAVAALGAGFYGFDDDTLEDVVCRLLREQGETVAVAESLTGGLLGATMSSPVGASDVFRGGITAYATELKESILEVPAEVLAQEGAVSSETARAMASGVRRVLDATYGLALTGVAGPTEQEGKPVGLVYVGLSSTDSSFARELRLPGHRPLVRTYSCVSALDLLRRHLLGTLES
jgi:nicotinamide-nucleotide amidase